MSDFINNSETESDIFSFEGFQVVRGEFFAHMNEPSLTINNYKINVNTACINKIPETDYVQILVNPEEKKLAIRPCNEYDRDAFLWCTVNSRSQKRKPRYITCKMFFAKLFSLMDWNADYKYKLLGKLIRSDNEHIFLFDLTSTEIYQRINTEGKKPRNSRIPVFPEGWKNQFGLPVEEHRKSFQVNICNGYAVYSISEKNNGELSNTEKNTDNKDQVISIEN